MRLIAAALLATATLVTGSAPLAAREAAPARAEAAFKALTDRYVHSIARFAPTYGTSLGDHSNDTGLPDLTLAGRGRQVAFDHEMLVELARIDRKALSPDSQVDAALLDNALRYDIWDIGTLHEWAWSPQMYNDVAAGALYSLAARDFAPWTQLGSKSAIVRMEGLPALLAQERAGSWCRRACPRSSRARSPSRTPASSRSPRRCSRRMRARSTRRGQARFDAALTKLKEAVAEHQKWLDTVLVPQAKGDFRLGAKLYDEKMRFALMSTLTRAEIKARAQKAAAGIRAQMYGLARQVLAGRPGAPPLPVTPTARQQQKAIEAAFELSYAQRPPRSGLMDKARATLAQTTDFVRSAHLITLPQAPVKIITMPVFQQGNSVAYCDSPGPLERDLDTFFAISPIPADWSDEQATSFLREYNDYMIQDLSIHEAMPGHYVQIAHSNENPSVLRAVLSSGSFVEGWAVYAEGMMSDAGYLGGDPLFKLTVLKMRLRSVTNSLLDIGIQTEGMTRDQAMTLMTKGAFQQEREAAGKWVRASLSSNSAAQLFRRLFGAYGAARGSQGALGQALRAQGL